MWKSFKSYVKDLGYWGLLVIAPISLDVIGVYQLVTGNQLLEVAPWVWFQISFVFLLIIPFIPYHKMRVRLQKITENRTQELHRLIIEVMLEAGRVVLLHGEKGNVKLDKITNKYSDAMKRLEIEAKVNGGDIEKAIQEFTSYVGIHIIRLLGFVKPTVISNKGNSKIEIDEYTFLGGMADRADEAIEKIKRVFER